MGRKKGHSRPAAIAGHNSDDDELIRGDLDEHEMRDELDEFELSRERALLAAGGGGSGIESGSRQRRAPAEVLAFDDDDSASDAEYEQTGLLGTVDGEELMDDTVEDGDELSGGWGKRKASYYSADYVDEDWRGATREETLEAAELEEREARAIQRRLAEQLEQDELQFGSATVRPAAETAEAAAADTEAIPLDTSGLSRSERLELLRKQCPELLPLMEEFRSRWTELSSVLEPLHALVRQGKVAAGPGVSYVTARRRLLLLYCLNISHYLTLRAERRATDSHPVMRRIAQYGRLLQTLAPADQAMAPHLERVRKLVADGVQLDTLSGSVAEQPPTAAAATGARRLKAGKRRPAAAGTAGSAVDRQLAALTMEIDALEREKQRLATEKEEAGPTFTDRRQAGQAKHNPLTPFRRKDRPAANQGGGGESAAAGDDDAPLDADQKRSITYQMAKNKGLMPKRSRESRNPRVKHKEKFKRAVKKRRSLVRQPKKELKKYGGEIFGIRMGAVKSVAIK